MVDEVGFPIFVPGNSEPHHMAADAVEWKQTYLQLVQRITTSAKLTDDAKKDKVSALWQANKSYIDTWTSKDQVAFKAAIVEAGGTVDPKKSPQEPEHPPNESESLTTLPNDL